MSTALDVDPASLLTASTAFLQLEDQAQVAVGQLVSGLAGSGGMGGDDQPGRLFAARYDTAARTVTVALTRAGKQLRDTADGLLAMASNYLAADQASDVLAPKAIVGAIRHSRGGSAVAPVVPSALGPGKLSGIPVIGQFTPQADPGRLRVAAASWGGLSHAVDAVRHRGEAVASAVSQTNRGGAADQFARSWRPLATLLDHAATGCRALQSACSAYAGMTETEQHVIEGIGATVGAVSVVGIGAAVFTGGLSLGQAAAENASAASIAGEAAAAFTTEVAGAVESGALSSTTALVDSAAAALPEIAPGAASLEAAEVSTGSLEITANAMPDTAGATSDTLSGARAGGSSPDAATDDAPQFASQALRDGHYSKHVINQKEFKGFDFSSPEAYERGAQQLVTNPDRMYVVRINGDTVHYLESSNELGISSSARSIQTYFQPEEKLNYFIRELLKASRP